MDFYPLARPDVEIGRSGGFTLRYMRRHRRVFPFGIVLEMIQKTAFAEDFSAAGVVPPRVLFPSVYDQITAGMALAPRWDCSAFVDFLLSQEISSRQDFAIPAIHPLVESGGVPEANPNSKAEAQAELLTTGGISRVARSKFTGTANSGRSKAEQSIF